MATVFLNGTFLEQDAARVSAFDAGMQHGVGLFETMLGGVCDEAEVRRRESEAQAITGIGAWVMDLEAHLERLIASARELGLSDTLQKGPLAEAVLRTIEKSGLDRARVRLTLTGGDLNLLARAKAPDPASEARINPTLLIVAQPATPYPPDLYERGSSVVIADLRLNPLDPTSAHKTLNYWARLRELQRAATQRAGEALVFQVTNHVAGGCVSSILLMKDGTLLTPIAWGEEVTTSSPATAPGAEAKPARPAMPSPVLPGVTRRWALAWAERNHVAVKRKMLTIDDVLAADEVMLTNSSWGVMPVVKVEREAIGDGVVGDATRDLIAAWEAATAT